MSIAERMLPLVLVADYVGVKIDEGGLATLDRLPISTLDLDELAASLEPALGITIPERELRAVRTYADVVQVAMRLAGAREETDRAATEAPAFAWVRVQGQPEDGRSVALYRTGPLTRYMVETLTDDTRYVGPSGLVTVSLDPDLTDAAVARVHERLETVRRGGVRVEVCRRGPLVAGPRVEGTREGRPGDEVLRAVLDFGMTVGGLLHAVEDEREASCLYVALPGAETRSELEQRHRATRATLDDVRRLLALQWEKLPASAREHAGVAVRELEGLGGVRATVLDLSDEAHVPFDEYSRIAHELLEAAAVVEAATPDAEYGRLARAFLSLLRARESVSAERGLACVLGTTSFPQTVQVALRSIIDARVSLLDAFRAMASPEAIEALGRRSADPAFAEVARLERQALEGEATERADVDVATWLRAASTTVERLREVEAVQLSALRRHLGLESTLH